MNATVAYLITVGSLVAMLLGYQGNYPVGILGIIVYVIAVLCALATAAMRSDTAVVLCIIFVPVIGLFCAISKYCSDKPHGTNNKTDERKHGVIFQKYNQNQNKLNSRNNCIGNNADKA